MIILLLISAIIAIIGFIILMASTLSYSGTSSGMAVGFWIMLI